MPSRSIFAIVLLTMGLSPVLPVNLALAQDGAPTNEYWWPNRLSLDPLRQTSRESNPLGEDFNYSEEFESLPRQQNLWACSGSGRFPSV